MFKSIIDKMENEDLKELANELVKTIPQYFFEVPASSTGKYHPSYSLGYGGLYRHTIALCTIMNHIFEVTNYGSREKDLMLIAGMMHDTRKSGSQEEYENNHYTNFVHPLKAAEVVRTFKDKYDVVEIEMIASCIESHMGKWNTDKRSNVVLPKPCTKYQNLVHLCDYLASRKDIEVKLENNINIEPKKVVIPFGKHKGSELGDVPLDYLSWLKNNADMNLKEPLKSAIDKILEDNK